MDNTIIALVDIVRIALKYLEWGLIAWAISSWLVAFNVVNDRNGFVAGIINGLDRVYSPMVAPIRRWLPDFGGIDLSPMVLILVLEGLQMLIPAITYDLLALGQ